MRTLTRRSALTILAASAIAGCGEPTEPVGPDPRSFLTTTYGAELLECPSETTISAEATVGAFGGTVRAGGSAITIPLGALRRPTRIAMTVPASNYVELRITADGAEHATFHAPVTVTIDYSRCTRSDIDQKTLGAWYIDAETKALLEPMNAIDDRESRTVRFETGHLSSYAVAH